MSEKPNLLKVTKSNVFVMYRVVISARRVAQNKISSSCLGMFTCAKIPVSRDFYAKECITVKPSEAYPSRLHK